MLRVAQALKPKHIAILGDFADGETLSAHGKTEPGTLDFADELEAVNGCLDQLDRLGATNKIYVCGNHEFRLDRYLMEHAPTMFRSMQWPVLLNLHKRGWKWTPYRKSTRIGKLHLTHDTGTAGINAHRTSAVAFGGSTVIGHCLPINYEVLTAHGFKSLADIAIGDMVLSYSEGQVEYVPVEDKVEWDYSGPMAEFNNQVIAQRMTSEHHIYTKDGRYLPVQQALKELTKGDLVRSALPLQLNSAPVSDNWLRLVIAYAADGSRSSKGSLRFHIKKERKIERLTRLWQAVGGSISWAAPGANGGRKTVGLDKPTQQKLIELCPDKQLPSWLLGLSETQRAVVVAELELWDGSVIKHDGVDSGIRQFCSHKPAEIDLVQLLLAQQGIRSSLFRDGKVIGYDIRQGEKSTDSTKPLSAFVKWAETKERVGCISTRNQNFFVRTTEGSVELTGNTHRMSYEVRGRFDGTPYLAAMLGWLGDSDSAASYMHEARASDWVHGFGIFYMEPQSGIVHLQPVPIVNGRCVVNGKLFT